MNPLRPQFIILGSTHKTFAESLIHHENDLRCNLRAEKSRLFHPVVLPLGEILWHFCRFDARRRLPMARMQVLRLALVGGLQLLLVVLLELLLRH